MKRGTIGTHLNSQRGVGYHIHQQFSFPHFGRKKIIMTKSVKNVCGTTPKDVTVRAINFTALRTACAEARLSIPRKPLQKLIDGLQQLNRQTLAVQKLEDAFMETVEAIRQLKVRCVFDDTKGKEGKRAFVPLLPLCRILGVRIPYPIDETNYDEMLWDFATKQLRISCDNMRVFGVCHVCSDTVPSLIRPTVGDSEIACRLEEWFAAHVTERLLAAQWDLPSANEFCKEDVPF